MTNQHKEELRKRAREEDYINRLQSGLEDFESVQRALNLSQEEVRTLAEDYQYISDWKVGYAQGQDEVIFSLLSKGEISMETACSELGMKEDEDKVRARAAMHGIEIPAFI